MKIDRARAIMIILNLKEEDVPEIMKLKMATLDRMFDELKRTALAYQHMAELVKQK